jgi:hypothetical protein
MGYSPHDNLLSLRFKQPPDLFSGQRFPLQQSPLDSFHTVASLF